MIHVGWPQGIWIVIVLVALVQSARRAERDNPSTAARAMLARLVDVILVAALLYWGGFFTTH